jgi:tRNA 2-thiouridine synthesizing protein A
MAHSTPRETPALKRGGRVQEDRMQEKRMTETMLDLMGLKCPLPALKTRKALKGVAAGERLVVACSDPLAEIDIPNLLRETGDTLEAVQREPGRLVFRIVKG